ncbi:MAG: NnrU family protein [Alphaproteobacteria bacterium]|nr:NnrU family protein [Alphaproteobacteria bacterium]
MAWLLLATAFFVGIHLLVAGTRLRDRLVANLGEGAYRGLFSLASILGLGAMVWSYNRAPFLPVWDLGPGARHAAALLLLLGFLLAVPGLTTRNPTAVGADNALLRPPAGIVAVTRHPFLWAVLLWAVGHLLANGDAASIAFFGGFLVLALFGPFSIDAKKARLRPDTWPAFVAATSWLPFQAIAQGRARLDWRELGWWRPTLGLLAYLAFVFYLHEALFGLRPI